MRSEQKRHKKIERNKKRREKYIKAVNVLRNNIAKEFKKLYIPARKGLIKL